MSGCSGVSYAMSNYTGVPITKVVAYNKLWWVYDKPAEARLMITPSLDDSFHYYSDKDLTDGIFAESGGEQGRFERAAQAYLNSTGRSCNITHGALVVLPQYEFFYTCT